jgi:hypothetical protein
MPVPFPGMNPLYDRAGYGDELQKTPMNTREEQAASLEQIILERFRRLSPISQKEVLDLITDLCRRDVLDLMTPSTTPHKPILLLAVLDTPPGPLTTAGLG